MQVPSLPLDRVRVTQSVVPVSASVCKPGSCNANCKVPLLSIFARLVRVSSPLAPLVFRGVLGDGRNDVNFYYCCLCVVLSVTTGVPGSLAG
jgi:hypothetical protein